MTSTSEMARSIGARVHCGKKLDFDFSHSLSWRDAVAHAINGRRPRRASCWSALCRAQHRASRHVVSDRRTSGSLRFSCHFDIRLRPLGAITAALMATTFALGVGSVAVLAIIFFVAGLYVAAQEALESTVTADLVDAKRSPQVTALSARSTVQPSSYLDGVTGRARRLRRREGVVPQTDGVKNQRSRVMPAPSISEGRP